MRRFTFLFFALLLSFSAVNAQTSATFDTLHLVGTDTFYVNSSANYVDLGFDDGLAHFPYYWSHYGIWDRGFSYSNMTDSATSGFTNDHSAKPAKGYNASSTYIVALQSVDTPNMIYLKGAAKGKPVYGFYLTNATYPYNSMRDGDAFAKKFGGTTGNDPDWFKLTIKGYYGGNLKPDSVDAYLADFRPANNILDTILNYWKWVNLLPLGNVDSLQFLLTTTDTAFGFNNTPTYFCMDNFTTFETMRVENAAVAAIVKIYPNPAMNELNVQLNDTRVKQMYVTDLTGKMIADYKVAAQATRIDISGYAKGMYILHLLNETEVASVKFIKQ